MTSPVYLPLPITVATLTVTYSVAGQEAVNVLGFVEDPATTGGGTAVSQELADEALAAWWTAVKPSMVGSVTLVSGVARGETGFGPGVFEAALPTGGLTGTETGAMSTLATTAVIQYTSTRGGRSGRGRTHLPGIPQDTVNPDGRTIESTWASGLTTRLQTYLAGVYGVCVPAVVSRRQADAYPITGASVRGIIGSQRNRVR